MRILFRLTAILVCTVYVAFSIGQSVYVPKEVHRAYEKGTRSPDGNPGANYWQNFSDYKIEANLDPLTRKLTGEETITYHNNSPDSLRLLVIKLLQNYHQKGAARDYHIEEEKMNDGVIIEELSINGQPFDIQNRKQIIIYGTNLYAIMDKKSKIAPDSETSISIKWNFEIPDLSIRVGAYSDSSYFMGYWFPQMAVYDDIKGWDREEYTGLQETYNDLANYKVKITVPDSYIVWATGDLKNSPEIFSSEVQKRIDESQKSDGVIHIITSDDYANNNIFKERATNEWYYVATEVPDFAFATSNYYLWDAKSVIVDHEKNRHTWVNTVYPPTAQDFKKAIDWAANSIEFFSTEFPGIPFPYNKHISYNGQNHAAIEFPMIANDCDSDQDEYLAEIVSHEIAHSYFPFMVLTNERLYAWMDEGWVKLFGERYTEQLGNKRENFKALNTTKIYNNYAGSLADLPLATLSSSLTPSQNFSQSYAKADMANVFMLEIMTEKGIKKPLKSFFQKWEGKHPTPWDYYNTMNVMAGEDLSWYWRPWYFNYTYPDLSLEYNEQDDMAKICVINKGKLPVPVIIKITYDNGDTETISKDPGVWRQQNRFEYSFQILNRKIEKITLGDDHVVDVYPEDNSWERNTLESRLY